MRTKVSVLIILTILLCLSSCNTKNDTDLNLVKQQLETVSGLNLISINYEDYDLDGYYEAFALMGEGAVSGNSKGEYGIETHNAEIWFFGRKGVQKLAEQFDNWSDDGVKMINGQAFWVASKYHTTEYISYIYYVKDGAPVEANISEKGGNFKCLDNGDVLLTFSEYDGMESEKMLLGHTYKDYFFFWNAETSQFVEYGGILLTKEDFLNINGASDLLKILEEEHISLEGIYYYANDTVAVNYNKGEYRYHLIIELHNGAFLRSFSIDDLYQKGGFLTTAFIPEIAIYPTEIPYYMQSR